MEPGIPILLVEPQVEGASQGIQARGLPDGAAGHVTFCERGRQQEEVTNPCTSHHPIPPSPLAPDGSLVFNSVGTFSCCPFRYHVMLGTGFPFRLLQVAIWERHGRGLGLVPGL